jgi:excinuclease ABC subunit B
VLGSVYEADYVTVSKAAEGEALYMSPDEIEKMVKDLTEKMKEAASKLDFEEAAKLRDRIKGFVNRELEVLSLD